MNAGYDYGMGTTNVDTDNGIRYGVINQNNVGQAWYDDAEPFYPDPCCPDCGNELCMSDGWEPEDDEDQDKSYSKDYCCSDCDKDYWSDEVFSEPNSYYYVNNGYSAECSADSGDIFVMKSPYYSRSSFCSPCAPGAGYLMTECEDGPKTYCFGHDWFENGVAPYKVWKVSDDSLVEPANLS